MDELIADLNTGRRNRDDPELYGEHCDHFERRVKRLDRSFFPGGERGSDAVRSLANGAFASFCSEPFHEARPAFRWVYEERFVPVTGPLYYWRASATIRYLREEGGELLRARARIQRNVRENLKDGFEACGSRYGETLWGLDGWSGRSRGAIDVERIQVDVARLRGRALIRAVLEAAETPLTRAEIASIIERAMQFADEHTTATPLEAVDAAFGEEVEARITETQIEPLVSQFWAELDADDRALLTARGFGEFGSGMRSFRQVAQLLGRSAETWRMKERPILETLRARFEPEVLPIAVRLLAGLIAKEASQ